MRIALSSFILVALAVWGSAFGVSAQFEHEIARPRVLWERNVPGVGGYDYAIHADRLFVHVWAPDGSTGIEARSLEDGAVLWRKELRGEIGPTIDGNLLVVGRNEVTAVALDDGGEVWRFNLPEGITFGTHATVDAEHVYVVENRPSPQRRDAVGPSAVFCLDAKRGTQIWTTIVPTGGAELNVDDRQLYVIREYGISFLNKYDGKVNWQSEFIHPMRVLPAVLDDFVLVPTQTLICLSAKDGTKVWSFKGGPMTSWPVICDGIVYMSYPQRPPDDPWSSSFVPTFVAARVRTGGIIWETTFPKEVRGNPLVTDESVYLVCWDNHLYRLDRKTGNIVWKFPMDFEQWAPTPILWRGRLYLVYRDKIVCIGES